MKRDFPQLLLSDKRGRVFSHPKLEATGMEAGHLSRLDAKYLIRLPPGSRLFMMPDRAPVGYDRTAGGFESPEDKYFAVGAHLTPGYTSIYSTSYKAISRPKPLPLFSYAAVALYKNEMFAAAVQVDRGRRHDPRFIDMARMRKNIALFRKYFARNRLVRHLERCAISYGCAGAQNFFLSRYECPLPTSPSCNAACAGCISYQKEKICVVSQPRIKFVPSPDEVAEIALFHIRKVKDPIVSFGQGCEGEPLLEADVIERSIKIIRRKTSKGVINMNTNGSSPEILRALFDAGLDSIRVSMNSAQGLYYARYYKPAGYSFADVKKSIEIAKEKGKFVSINYLTMPGFTDIKEEFAAMKIFIKKSRIDMIQWRNLNFDPLVYFKILRLRPERDRLIGVRKVIDTLKETFPNLMMGYFNPSRLAPILHAAVSQRR